MDFHHRIFSVGFLQWRDHSDMPCLPFAISNRNRLTNMSPKLILQNNHCFVCKHFLLLLVVILVGSCCSRVSIGEWLRSNMKALSLTPNATTAPIYTFASPCLLVYAAVIISEVFVRLSSSPSVGSLMDASAWL